MPPLTRVSLLTLCLLLLIGCAALPPGKRDARDPWERMNRTTYRFNDKFDRAIAQPVARGYRKTPRFVQTGVHNFFTNLDYPIVMVNDLLQGQLKPFVSDTARLLINTTIGIGGLLDPATAAGLDRNDRDLGQTLGKWGVKKGPYVVLPFLGPSDVRDAFGRLGDDFSTPRQYLRNPYWDYGLYLLNAVDSRARLLDATKLAGEHLRSLRVPAQRLPAEPRLQGERRTSAERGGARGKDARRIRRGEHGSLGYRHRACAVIDAQAASGPDNSALGAGATPADTLICAATGLAAAGAAAGLKSRIDSDAALEQSIDLADAGKRGDAGRQLRVAQRAAGAPGRAEPVEQHREPGAVGGGNASAGDLECGPGGGAGDGLLTELARRARGGKGQRPLGGEAPGGGGHQAENSRGRVADSRGRLRAAHPPLPPFCLAIARGLAPDSSR